MSAPELTRSRQEAEIARRRLLATAGELQRRLSPGTIASNVWEDVTDKAGEVADGAMEAVKARPVAVSAGLGALGLFLARGPIRSAVGRLFAKRPPADQITSRLETADPSYDLTAPVAVADRTEGASA
jgi:hypothetical protein